MYDFHGTSLPSRADADGVRRGEGREIQNLTLGLEGTNPRFPWKPSATMLSYRLKAPQSTSGSTTTNHISVR